MDSLWNPYVTWQEHTVKCTVQISTQNRAQSNSWMFLYELSGSVFESSCSHWNFRFCVTLEQGVAWYSGNNRVWILSETRTWHNKNIQSNAPYRYVLRTQLNQSASLAKWLSVHFGTKWFWVRVQLQSIKLQVSRLLWARSFLTFRQL